MVENVTRRGAFVATDRRLAPGALVAFRRSNCSSDNSLAFAQVVWVRSADGMPAGVGLRIVSDNARWMDYLIEHSVRSLDEPDRTVK